jgi:hypothetical protein
MSRTVTVVLAAVVALGLAACTQQAPEITAQQQVPASARTEAPAAEGEDGGDAGGEAAEGTPSVWIAIDVDFSDFDTELPAGPIALTMDNEGNLPHNIVIEELGSQPVVEADGGGSDTASVELEPGEYTFFCSIPGHRGTMEEIVTVS